MVGLQKKKTENVLGIKKLLLLPRICSFSQINICGTLKCAISAICMIHKGDNHLPFGI